MKPSVLDLGCGKNKAPGSFGVDIHSFEGVDLVIDLDKTPWPIETGSFDHILCKHLIEHVRDIPGFMREIHRISRPNATFEVVTPHFSSIFSWNDPTHARHLAMHWYKPFAKNAYLSSVIDGAHFEKITSIVTFGGSFRATIGKGLYRLLGPDRWERDWAFGYPGRDIQTSLRIIK